jgi:hypothetical protein
MTAYATSECEEDKPLNAVEFKLYEIGDTYILEGVSGFVFFDILEALEAGRRLQRRVIRRSDGAFLTNFLPVVR